MVKKKRSAWEIALYTISGVFLVFFIASSVLIAYWKPIISDIIKKDVNKATKGLYNVDFDNINVFLLLGNVSVSNLRLTPNDKVYKELSKRKEQPDYLFAFQIDRFKISGLNLFDVYKYKEIHIEEVEFKNPKIKLFIEHRDVKPESDGKSFKNPYDLIKSNLKAVKIENILFKNVDMQVTADSLGQRKISRYSLNYIDISNLVIDSLASTNTARPFYTDDIKVSMKNFEFPLRDSLNTLKFEEMILSTAGSSIELYNLKIIPKYTEKTFKDLNGFRKLRADLYIKSAKVEGVDYKTLIYGRKLHAKSLKVRDLNAKFHNNKLLELNPNRKIKFPIDLINTLRFPFYIDNVNITQSDISYAETIINKKDTTKTNRWVLKFNDINMRMLNVGNDSSMITNAKKLDVEFNCLLNNKARTTLSMIFPYYDKNRSFNVRGRVMHYKLQNANSIITQFAPLEINNCDLEKLEFYLNGNDKSMFVNLRMIYKNLRIGVLKYDDQLRELKKSGFISALANTMVLNNDNPLSNGKFVHPKFMHVRNPQHGFFAYIWNGIFKGIKESVGFTDKMEAEMKYGAKRIKEIKSFRKKYKEWREIRKEEKELKKQKKLESSKELKSSEI